MSTERTRRLPIPHEFVLDARRLRITEAHADLCLEQGYRETTVAHIVERAGVSRVSFYEVFPNRCDSFTAVVTRAATGLEAVLSEDPPSSSECTIDAALQTSLQWLAEHEALASALLIDAPSGPPDAHRAQLELMDTLALRLAHATGGQEAQVTNLEQMLIGGVAGVVRGLVLANELSLAPERARDLSRLFARMRPTIAMR